MDINENESNENESTEDEIDETGDFDRDGDENAETDVTESIEPAPETDDMAHDEHSDHTDADTADPVDDGLGVMDDDARPDELWDESTTIGGVAEDEVTDDEPVLPPPYAAAPPPLSPHPSVNRLVRDPNATLGGIASGVAHRYGWDVALTRLAFVVLTLASSGFGLLVYLLAWLIIPRADYWPPAPSGRRGRLSTRDVGIGLAAVGALLALAIGGGEFGVVLIPLALVGGGIWLLVQNPRTEPALAGHEVSFAATPPPAAMAPPAPTVTQGYPPSAVAVPPAASTGAPVPRRSRRRRFALMTLVGMAFLALLAVIAIPIALLIAVNNGEINFSTDNKVEVRPASIEEIPTTIIEDAGEVVLDLSSLDVAEFDDIATPIEVIIDVDFGSIRVVLPEDLVASIDAEADIGSVRVFGEESDGIGNSRTVDRDDPDLDLELDLNVGEIVVTRRAVGASSIEN